MSELEMTAVQARMHAENARLDIGNAMTRAEHIRLTRLAIEADQLAARLERMILTVAL